MELCVQAVPQIGHGGRFPSPIQRVSVGRRPGIRDDPFSRIFNALPGNGSGRSRGGIQTKILALTDDLGNLVDCPLLGPVDRPCQATRQAHNLRETDTLIRNLTAGHLLADRAFDVDWLRNDLKDRDIIPPKSNRKLPATLGKETYK